MNWLTPIFLRNLPAALLAVSWPLNQSAGEISREPLSARIANYQIVVELNADQKKLTGQQQLTWHNTSADTLHELQFHLYLNAFRSSETTFMKESSARNRRYRPNEDGWGWIDVTSMKTNRGEDLMNRITFIQPDDHNEHDSTVIRVSLPTPILPGRSLQLEIGFIAQLPVVFARTGYQDDFLLVAQWFPKIGVYEPAGTRGRSTGGWNCHQFHAQTEFYADFGTYDVQISLPQRYLVGATGTLGEETVHKDGTKTVRYHADDVHDFAWAASPFFTEITDTVTTVVIRLLLQQDHLSQAVRHLQAARTALLYMSNHVGPYPYPSLTIVDPAYRAEAAGGMEYPMLITTGTIWGIGEYIRWPERVVTHELVHQYWYGMVANNEFEEAWLDEGLATYYECRIIDETFGSRSSSANLLGLKAGSLEISRSSFVRMRNPRLAPIASPTWEVPHRSFGQIVYHKTALVLATLDRLIGRPLMDSAMQRYFRRWRFRHPSGQDLLDTINEVVVASGRTDLGQDLDWYFSQVLYGTEICDFEVTSLECRPVLVTRSGFEGDTTEQDATPQNRLFESTIVVTQRGEVKFPVPVRIRFENGDEAIEHWNGQLKSLTLTYRRPARAVSAEVDPDVTYLLDMNLVNNSKTIVPPTLPVWKYTSTILVLIQSLLQMVSIIG